ncbi:MAG: AAA family ATPase [Janthinobacterium lividum]
MNQDTEKFVKFIEAVINDWNIHRQIALESKTSEDVINIIDAITDFCKEIMRIAYDQDLKVNYLNQFEVDINQSYNFLPYKNQVNNNFIYGNERLVKEVLESYKAGIEKLYTKLSFNLYFFKKLSFFNNNIVAIGANGSGKTSLSNKLKTFIKNNGLVVSAQRILLVPQFDAINNPTTTLSELKQYQLIDKTNKDPSQFHFLQQEFSIVLKNLLAQNISVGNQFRKQAVKQIDEGINVSKPPITNLDSTLEIWNSLMEHSVISCSDGINITVESEKKVSYPIVQMSDGEKVMLFLIAQILQAPRYGFVIVDEPEMYLHKTILNKLWDILEKERQDCIFVYLTHDLDFATSRTTAKKIWIKSFTHPEVWEIEDIPENELPESLLLELLGSRKNILFCEGEKGSIDEKVYNILFPDFTITPVGTCFQVINHTKAFNKIPKLLTYAFGLVDTDHHLPERLEKLKGDNIFSFSVSEVENLFLDEEFLKYLAKNILVDDSSIIDKIKFDIIDELNKHKVTQAANFVSNRIDYYFKDSNIKKGNSVEEIESNYKIFTEEIDINEFFKNRLNEIEAIILGKDYCKAISVYNNKGLKGVASKYLKITDFTDRAIKLLQFHSVTHKMLLRYFPKELTFKSII